MRAYQIDAKPTLIDLGSKGRADVVASVPFMVAGVRHCPNYPHRIDLGRRQAAAFQAIGGSPAGVLTLWPAR